MVRLIAIHNARMAQAFVDYMASRQIEITVTVEGDGQNVLWLKDERFLPDVDAELKRFLHHPNHAKYQAASWHIADTQTKNLYYASPNLLLLIKNKAGPFTLAIMIGCIAIFLLQLIGFGDWLFYHCHYPDNGAQRWQLWRWFTHAFLHFSVLHIVFNLLWWWQLGGDIEKRVGSQKLVNLFIVSATLSGALQYWFEGANFGGLSGVVYALVGYLWMMSSKVPQLGLDMPKPLLGFMLVWLMIGFVQPFVAIANSAHVGGLVVGVILGLIDARRYQRTIK
jgi:GlpG protein